MKSTQNKPTLLLIAAVVSLMILSPVSAAVTQSNTMTQIGGGTQISINYNMGSSATTQSINSMSFGSGKVFAYNYAIVSNKPAYQSVYVFGNPSVITKRNVKV
jgi:hypothetical protein